jgi:hypothetical protein
MSSTLQKETQKETLIFEVGEKKYEIRPAPLKMLKKIWTALPKITSNASDMQQMITAAGGADKVGTDDFMKVHVARVDTIVKLLCDAAGIDPQEAEDNMTRDQVENLTGIFNRYLEISGFLKDEVPNGGAGPIVTGPLVLTDSTETGTRSQLN